MSDGHGHDSEHDDAAEAHDDHGFDGEPARELGPEEPMTPMWLPGVGAAIFALGAVYFLATGDTTGSPSSAPVSSAPPKSAAAPAHGARGAGPRPERPGAPAARGRERRGRGGSSATDQLKDLQKRIKEAQEKKQQQGANGAK